MEKIQLYKNFKNNHRKHTNEKYTEEYFQNIS